MNRFFKVIFCLILVAAILLPALPMSSKAASEETFEYIFSKPDNVESEGIKTITKDNYKTITRGSYTWNWYYLEDSFGTNRIVKFESSGMTILDTVGAHWIALVIDVPKAGYYDLNMRIRMHTQCGVGNIYIIPATEENKVGLAASTGIDVSNKVVRDATPIGTIDFYGYKTQNNHTADRELQSMYLTAGEHILIFQGKSKGRGGTAYMCPVKLTLTKKHTVVSSADALMQEMIPNNGKINLDTDLTVGALTVPAGTTLDLNGHKLTCDSFFASAKGKIVDSTDGNGALIVKDPLFPNIEEYIPLYDEKIGGYRIFAYDVSTNQIRKENYGRTFQLNLEFSNKKAYNILASGTSGLEIDLQFRWTDKTDPCVYTTKGASNSPIKLIGKTEGPMSVTVNNLDQLSAQILSMTPVLHIRGQSLACVAIISPIIK